MTREQELFDLIQGDWSRAEQDLFQQFSRLEESNKAIHEKPLKGSMILDATQRTMWETVNQLDQLLIESMKERALLIRALLGLVTAWHEHQEDSEMNQASNRFVEMCITPMMKSGHAESALSTTVDNLRRLLFVSFPRQESNEN